MPDPRFFKRFRSFSLQELATLSCAQLGDNADPSYVIEDVNSLEEAGAADLSFLDNLKYKEAFKVTKAGACFVSPAVVDIAPKGLNLLVSKMPYKSYALAAQAFYPVVKPDAEISDKAFVSSSAIIAKGCVIEEGAVIRDGVSLGAGTWVQSHAVIGENVQIGEGCRIGSHVTITHAILGSHITLYPGVRIGQDGFGFAIDPCGHVKVPQLGRVLIEDHVEIGANTTIDRGAGPDTVIGQGTWIDNLVQIAHNVKIGRGCIIVSQVGISGSTVIEDFVAIGGQAGIAGHLHVGTGARIGAQSGVMRDIPAGEEQMGSPALPSRQFMRQVASLGRLIKKK